MKSPAEQPILSPNEKARAAELCCTRACPYCGVQISLRDVIAMIQGDGFARTVKVRHESGKVLFLPTEHVNPQTMLVLSEEQQADTASEGAARGPVGRGCCPACRTVARLRQKG
jgi:hypothetical protein